MNAFLYQHFNNATTLPKPEPWSIQCCNLVHIAKSSLAIVLQLKEKFSRLGMFRVQ